MKPLPDPDSLQSSSDHRESTMPDPSGLCRRALLRMPAGTAAVAALLNQSAQAEQASHFAPRAKRVVYLFQSGGPSHLELLDEKPGLRKLHGTELPDSIRRGQRLTGMTSGQSSFPVVAPKFGFRTHGQCGLRISELLPHTGAIADQPTISWRFSNRNPCKPIALRPMMGSCSSLTENLSKRPPELARIRSSLPVIT